MKVRAKKHLGQHFLRDMQVAQNIVDAISASGYDTVLEIGPGMGVLTQFMLEKTNYETFVVEIDRESVAYLRANFPKLSDQNIFATDFLKLDFDTLFKGKKFGVIGNLPYNISSQIFFKLLQHRNAVPELVCMLQKEVAVRIASPAGKKDYGILSVFLQAFYDIEYLFTVPPSAFVPPPKVQSGVVRLKRNDVSDLGCDETLFFQVVKTAFNQRRKTLRNALKPLGVVFEHRLLDLRAERLNVTDFVELTNEIANKMQA
jgi:16S rRNA (adenine1518-N6/adenine1519-N6)-dimethyltransferase